MTNVGRQDSAMMRYKFQIPSTKPQTNFQVLILKVGMQIFEPSELEFPWNLGFVFWDFRR
jgi:hypothetical protein